VLGIGLDMGIFLQESGNAPQTWQAVSLSCVTSLLAFGLLSLSQTPVLYHFGLIVLIGLSLTWILAIIFSNYYSGNTLNDTASGDC
jgi:predicted exporter